ncbi:lytic transglycosylase domain-containing protein [Acinetobacter modestus]|uniref:lytic transglycosylase domain-containing protein n=1 Tax=Acinetobacter modestus TaxID=1776740 RepID=UPI00301593E2
MSFSIGAIANGLANGLDRIQQQQRYNDELKYNRERQAVADQQAAEIHNQQVQRQKQVIDSGIREAEEFNRVKALQGVVGQIQQSKLTGDADGAFKTATDYINHENSSKPDWNQDHIFGYTKDTTDPNNPTFSLNLVDKNTGQVVRQLNGAATTDSLIDMFYKQINPVGAYENAKNAAATKAAKEAEQNFELKKIGIQSDNDIKKENTKYANDLSMEKYKFGNQSQMEKYKQGQENYRAELSQGGQNYRTEITAAGKTSTLSDKTKSSIANGVNGAIQFAENNASKLSFLSNDPNTYLKTVAMMGIESGGKNVDSYNGVSSGYMQINKGMVGRFEKAYGTRDNIKQGAYFIRDLDKKYNGDPSLVAAAYNAGEPAVDRALKAWNNAGQKGGWFDYLDISEAAKNEALNHVLKYNHALSLMSGTQRQTIEQGKEQYAKDTAKVANTSIQSIATKMSGELGLEKKTAPILGALTGAQSDITKFANAKTSTERANAFNNIALRVENAVKNTEAGIAMTPQARREYIYQYASELVGAANKTEAGLWITGPKKKQIAQQQANRQAPTLSASEVDNVFGVASSNVSTNKGIPNTIRKPDNGNTAIQGMAASAVQKGLSALK